MHLSKLALAAIYLRRVRVGCHTFALGAPLVAHVLTALRLRQKILYVGLRRPCRGRACAGMLGATALAAVRMRHKPRRGLPAALPGEDVGRSVFLDWPAFRLYFKPPRHDHRRLVVGKKSTTNADSYAGRRAQIILGLAAYSSESPLGAA
jgi:hypothetical protein